MSALPSHPALVTVEEYLRREGTAEERHEYWEGEILANSGGTYRHSVIIANVIGALWSRLRGKPCQVSDANTRVALKSRHKYVYPDAVVVCGGAVYDPADVNRTTILNPTLVVEVLSEGTEAHDRGRKFTAYRDVASLKQYVLVDSEGAAVETFLRQEDGTWVLGAEAGLESTVRLEAIGVEIPLGEIYERVEFEPSPE